MILFGFNLHIIRFLYVFISGTLLVTPLSATSNVVPSGDLKQPEIASTHYEIGKASWYGKRFHGKKTSSGERFDMHALTAAHRTLPIPSYAKVTNLQNGKTVIVRVNDRGPYKKHRVIDLSYAAAQALAFVQHGHTPVSIEALSETEVDHLLNPHKAQTKRHAAYFFANWHQSTDNFVTLQHIIKPDPGLVLPKTPVKDSLKPLWALLERDRLNQLT